MAREFPTRPQMPPPRVQRNGMMFKSEAEMRTYDAEPLWRRLLGLTAYARRLKGKSDGA